PQRCCHARYNRASNRGEGREPHVGVPTLVGCWDRYLDRSCPLATKQHGSGRGTIRKRKVTEFVNPHWTSQQSVRVIQERCCGCRAHAKELVEGSARRSILQLQASDDLPIGI